MELLAESEMRAVALSMTRNKMKKLILFVTIAMIQHGVVVNEATWDGHSNWDPGSQYTLVDISGKSVKIGSTCVKCDGTDFVAPSEN